MPEKKKLDSVSLAKAIAIFFMVLAHTFFSKQGDKIINMFHMSLFFFLAGYCFNESNLCNFKMFAKKRIRGLYFPYVKWSLFFLLLHNLFCHLNIYNSFSEWEGIVFYKYEMSDYIIRAFHIVSRMFDHEQLLGGFWFLRCLFVVSFLGYALIRCCRDNVRKYVCGLIFLFVGAIMTSYFNKHIPIAGIGSKELLASIFFVTGYLYRKKFFSFPVWCYPLASVAIVVGSFYWSMGYLGISYWKIVPWMISSFLGVVTVYDCCRLVEKKNFIFKSTLIYIGNNTLTILALHFLCFKIVSLIIILFYNLPIEYLGKFPVVNEYSEKGWWIAYVIVGMFLPILFCAFLDKLKLRFFVANKE